MVVEPSEWVVGFVGIRRFEARPVVSPAHDGEMGIQTNRAPPLCQLGIGALRVETETEKHVFMVD